jgi:D-alanyl-lipoteichoic acid acyltransferase DltB (MBOAT superfamily)
MLPALFVAIAVVPLYWLAVPAPWRRWVLALASLAVLSVYDPRLLPLLVLVTLGVSGGVAAMQHSDPTTRRAIGAAGVAALVGLFAWNKLAGGGLSVLPSQSGVAFLGVSFLVLKAAGVLLDGSRGALRAAPPAEILAWLVFLPTYPSGPVEHFEHFRTQRPHWTPAGGFGGLERILFGLVKALLVAHYLGEWTAPILAEPEAAGTPLLLAAFYGLALRFYFDLAGYSDIAIGLSALYGYDIAENFDRPLTARNLALLWQRWHMTVTGWLRTYTFTPLTRALMRRSGRGGDRIAVTSGLLATFLLIGLWHGLSWNFALYGLLQGLAVAWVSVFARDAGRRILSAGLVRWWRGSRLGYALSTALTFNFFALTSILVMTDLAQALRCWRALLG